MLYKNYLKRVFDMFLSVTGVLILSPVVVVIAILVRLAMGSPVIFTQTRPGRHGKLFLLYKFRTMNNKRDAVGNLLSDAERLTGLGKFLRATSLDELPELFNVLLGHMSLVGPRPLLVKYLERYTPEQARRHEVKPGITGWAQINGRNSQTWDERFGFDLWYVDNYSFWLDLQILLITIIKVLQREGINADSEATMAEFQGSTIFSETYSDVAASIDNR